MTKAQTQTITSFFATRPVWLVGVLAACSGAVVTEAFAFVARVAGVPMEAANSEAKEAATIPVGSFAGGVLLSSMGGIILAVALARWAKRPARAFALTTVMLTVFSLAGPAVAPYTATSTQIILALSHVVAASVVIPPLAQRLSSERQ